MTHDDIHDLPAYLDYNATTLMDPRVFEAMRPWFVQPANAGSRTHWYGQKAKQAVDDARSQIAHLLATEPENVIFTSGATESNNLAILGLSQFGESTGRKHIISTTIEHKAVLEPLEQMARHGFDVELCPVTHGGYVEPDEIRKRLRSDTLLVSVMHSNNETGILQEIELIAQLIAGSEILLHTDAAQTFGKEIESLRRIKADFISISGHKIYGPQGIGGLCARRRAGQKRPTSPISFGGGQERGLRPGTVPVALAVGLGRAAQLAESDHDQRHEACAKLRQTLLAGLNDIRYAINGDSTRMQPHVLNIRFVGVDAEALMMSLTQSAAFSNGSACTAAAYLPSHVLQAMGLSDTEIAESVRLTWGPDTTQLPVEDIVQAIKTLVND